MNSSSSLKLVSILLGLLSTQPFYRQSGPNVVFILTDDQRAEALSCMGHPHLRTPRIDRLADEGALFKNHFCTTSLCSPSRASILGGLYAHTHGVVNNFTDYPRDLPTFPRQLQAEGYSTAYIGKWHMGEDDDSKRPGFNHFVTHRGQGKYFDTEFRANSGERKIVPGYYTTVITDMAIDWMKEQEIDSKNHSSSCSDTKHPTAFTSPNRSMKTLLMMYGCPTRRLHFPLMINQSGSSSASIPGMESMVHFLTGGKIFLTARRKRCSISNAWSGHTGERFYRWMIQWGESMIICRAWGSWKIPYLSSPVTMDY